MSFAMNLQSETGQKVIMQRIENEVRVLENLRKFLLTGIKAGREYSSVLQESSKNTIKAFTDTSGVDNTVINEDGASTDSVATKVCLHILEEVQSSATSIKENIEYIQNTTLTQLNELIKEKKNLLKLSHLYYQNIKRKQEQVNEKFCPKNCIFS